MTDRRTLGRSLGTCLVAAAVVASMVPASAMAKAMGKPPSGGGADTQSYDYSGTLSGKVTASGKKVTKKSKTIKSTKKDVVSALAKSGGKLTLKKCTLKKSGSDTNGDNCNFYGVNSILLATGSSSKAYVSGSKLVSTGQGSNGIFATNGAIVYANNDTVTTSKSSSRGLDATYGGTIIANKLTINTKNSGEGHCAALATDRGGGNVSVTNSKLKTASTGSPLIYSTGNIQVDHVTGTAKKSQIAGMEGLNTIYISNSKLTSTSNSISGRDPMKNGVIIYQSTSGDADTSTGSAASFQAVKSTLSTSITSGAMFYLTNTKANVVLKKSTLKFKSSKVNLISAVSNSNGWGTTGSNGAKVKFTGIKQKLKGNVQVDSKSSIALYLLKGSSWKGTLASGSKASKFKVNIDASSKWVVTANTAVGALNVASGGKVVDADGKTVTIKNSSGKVLVKGTSKLTVTAKSYSTSVKTGSVNKVTSSSKLISRTAFDKKMGTTTTFGKNSKATIGASVK